jgi:hypothetical protein
MGDANILSYIFCLLILGYLQSTHNVLIQSNKQTLERCVTCREYHPLMGYPPLPRIGLLSKLYLFSNLGYKTHSTRQRCTPGKGEFVYLTTENGRSRQFIEFIRTTSESPFQFSSIQTPGKPRSTDNLAPKILYLKLLTLFAYSYQLLLRYIA